MSLAKLMMVGGTEPKRAIDNSGNLWACGDNRNGRLGNGLTTNVSSPIQIGSLVKWASISANSGNSHGIRTDGTIWGWGNNNYSNLGISNLIHPMVAPIKMPGTTTWVTLTSGNDSGGIINSAGELWMWGYNANSGMVGQGNTTNYSSPVQVGSLTNWLTISIASQTPTCIKTDGTLWAWGLNAQGQVGDGTTTNRSSPVQIGGLTTWESASSGYQHGVAIKTDGTLWAWGSNTYGQLGQGNTTNSSSPAQIGSATNWATCSGVRYQTFAINDSGELWACGDNPYGFLGDGTTTDRSSLVQIGSLTTWSILGKGCINNSSMSAIKTDGTLWSWGRNDVGQIGDGSTTDRSSPVQIGSLTNWASAALGYKRSTYVTTTGEAWGTGYNGASGELGIGKAFSANVSSPVQIGNHSPWVKIGGSHNHIHGVTADGKLWGWGLNTLGVLGDGTEVGKSFPVQIGTSTRWNATGFPTIGHADKRSAIIDADGKLFTSGKGATGVLGSGSTSNLSTLTQVGSLTNWKLVRSGSDSVHAIKTDGTLWGWGYNADGRVGDGTTTVRSSPVQLGALTTWDKLGHNNGSVHMIKTDGTLWAVGPNGSGDLGDGTTTTRSSPVQIGSETDWTSIGSASAIAAVRGGKLFTWGYNAKGQAGHGDTTNRSSPTQVGTDTDWVQAWGQAQDATMKVTKTDGTMWVFGANEVGALGLGTTANTSSPAQLGSIDRYFYAAGVENYPSASYFLIDDDND